MHQQVGEGSAGLHSSHQLSVLLVRQHQAMPLEQQHSRAAMPLVVQLSSQALLEGLSRVQGLEEGLGASGLLLAALPQLNLLRRPILACGQCADDVIVISAHKKLAWQLRLCMQLPCKRIIYAQPVFQTDRQL